MDNLYQAPYKPFEMTDRVLLVTGGARGVGEQIARMGTARGAKVVIGDILDDLGEAVAKSIRDAGGECYFKHFDACIEEECKALVEFAVEKFGALHLAANNHGHFKFVTPAASFPTDEYDKHMRINAYGTYYLMKYELAQMEKQGVGGAITNTGSLVGLVSQPNMIAYVASKHAVVGMTKVVAEEYGKQNIRCNCICPGSIMNSIMREKWETQGEAYRNMMTNGVPLERVSEPSEQSEAILWTLSDSASYLTGAIINVDGGKFNAS